ncbi:MULTISPECIES: ABC transporter substrate-binding protein [Halocynthiibacter]|uniref:ABC transporter substrate-binding protein n=1 Tax=Halocynthiibacter halioticoli TaxID=2986804 RepID=A0AAE3J1N4_9RHOB|nr:MULTISPECIES: ABC transporter substrate-binding protein [Halocynthiibacter]MCV6824476.1 ABC transporter substrate-binding protein [Halocynthiibacter halioticoli]MCW4057477.1 ABC transporter substrate-binding protein [Halocynthiibacter sp. SDUM655004]
MKRYLMTSAASLMLCAGAAQADLMFAPGEGDFTWDSYEALKSMDLSGETISVFGPWLGLERDRFNAVIAYFEEATGANVEYAGSDSFEQQILIDTEGGSAPNIAVFPQPGLAASLAAKGLLAPLTSEDADWVRDNFGAGQSWVDLATFADENGDDQLFGMFYRADLKSLVWYVPENFEDSGYEIPQTMEELKALTDQIVADGGTPWCIGLGSGAATGWPATDWVEDLLLRTAEPSVYDQWVANEIPFDDPAIVAAIEEFGAFARNDDYVAGGAGAVASTDFRDSPKGLFASPPQCYMHRQASFIPAFFPEDTMMGEDADFFYFPSYESKDLGKPVLGAGTVMTITNDSKGARAFMEFLKAPIAHEAWMAQGGFLTAHSGVNTAVYENDAQRKMGDILLNADTFRFDGSDLMPGAIGAGAFWTGMVDYAGGKDATEVAKSIQETWDGIK